MRWNNIRLWKKHTVWEKEYKLELIKGKKEIENHGSKNVRRKSCGYYRGKLWNGTDYGGTFAEEGASVVLTARGKEKLNQAVEGICKRGGKAIGIVADTCSTADTKKVMEKTIETFGDLDILINNAGIGEQKMIDETDDEWMMQVMNTNLGGPMRYIREALKIFMPKNEGVIINISSVNGNRPFCGVTYTSTKGALNTLTKMWQCG